MELISVIIPVYNVEKYLRKCLDSVCNQSYKRLEIILVDDGSTDGSGAICDEYAYTDKRIRVVHKENGGLSDARNVGLDHATGQYIGFVDSDDFIEFDMYEKLYTACVLWGADISLCGKRIVNENGCIVSEKNIVDAETLYTSKEAICSLLTWKSCDSAAWDKLYSANLFLKIRYPFGKLHEDLNVTCRLFELSNKIIQIPYVGYNYLLRSNSICRQSLSKRKFDLYEQAKFNVDFVCGKYPDLKEEADFFLLACSLGVISTLMDSSTSSIDDYKRVNDILNEICKIPLRNSYLKWNRKIAFVKKYILFKLSYCIRIITER